LTATRAKLPKSLGLLGLGVYACVNSLHWFGEFWQRQNSQDEIRKRISSRLNYENAKSGEEGEGPFGPIIEAIIP
jgi:hypothetical protein